MMQYLPYLMALFPIVATLVVWVFGFLPGKKTNINGVFAILIGGYATLDLSWMPPEIVAPLGTGFAISVILSNTLLTERL